MSQGSSDTNPFNLTFDGVFLPLYLMAGPGVDSIHHFFMRENNKKSRKFFEWFLHGKV